MKSTLNHVAKVSFLHRTAKDFLNTPEMRKRLGDGPGMQLRIASRMVNANLFIMMLLPEAILLTHDDFIYQFLRNAQLGEAIMPFSMFAALDECERFLLTTGSGWKFQRKKTRFLAIAAMHGHLGYLQYRLRESPRLLESRERPILDVVLMNDPEDYESGTLPIRTDVVEFLLGKGASPLVRYNDSTIWERFVHRLGMLERSGSLKAFPSDLAFLAELMVLHGGRLDLMLLARDLTVDLYNLYDKRPKYKQRSIAEILLSKLTMEQMQNLSLAVKSQRDSSRLSAGLSILRKLSPFGG